MRKVLSVAFVAVLTLCACKSARVTKFESAAQAVCDCKDAACAKTKGAVFVDAFNALESEKIDWQSAQGKKESAAITEAGKVHNACMEKLAPREEANKFCTSDAKGKASSAGCKSCCRDQGRAFKYWADPMAAGLVGALGGPKDKGCGCT